MKSFGRWFADQAAPVAPAVPDEPELPDGLWMSSLGLTYKCYACGEDSEWPVGPEDFDINNSANQCPILTPERIEEIMADWSRSSNSRVELCRAVEAAVVVALAAVPGKGGPVAQICGTWELRWIGSGPIAPIVHQHGLKIGDFLYAAAPVGEVVAATTDATEAAELQTLLTTEFGCYRPTHPAGLMRWAHIALMDNSPHRMGEAARPTAEQTLAYFLGRDVAALPPQAPGSTTTTGE